MELFRVLAIGALACAARLGATTLLVSHRPSRRVGEVLQSLGFDAVGAPRLAHEPNGVSVVLQFRVATAERVLADAQSQWEVAAEACRASSVRLPASMHDLKWEFAVRDAE
jgi:hypothetical protein